MKTKSAVLGQWTVDQFGGRLWITLAGKPGVIEVQATHEGFIVDINAAKITNNGAIDSACAEFSQLEEEKEI